METGHLCGAGTAGCLPGGTLSRGFTGPGRASGRSIHLAGDGQVRALHRSRPARRDPGESREITVTSPDLCGLMDELDDLFGSPGSE